jgi:hypothetical protein
MREIAIKVAQRGDCLLEGESKEFNHASTYWILISGSP